MFGIHTVHGNFSRVSSLLFCLHAEHAPSEPQSVREPIYILMVSSLLFCLHARHAPSERQSLQIKKKGIVNIFGKPTVHGNFQGSSLFYFAYTLNTLLLSLRVSENPFIY